MRDDEAHQQELEHQMQEEFERIDKCMEALEEMSKPWWWAIDNDLNYQEEMK